MNEGINKQKKEKVEPNQVAMDYRTDKEVQDDMLRKFREKGIGSLDPRERAIYDAQLAHERNDRDDNPYKTH